MEKRILIITLIIVISAAFLVGFSLGYVLYQKQMKAGSSSDTVSLPSSPLIKYWRTSVAGKITEITPQAITISSGNETLTLVISEETKVKKPVFQEDKSISTIDNLSLQDIKKDDFVSVGIKADLEGNLWADVVYTQEAR